MSTGPCARGRITTTISINNNYKLHALVALPMLVAIDCCNAKLDIALSPRPLHRQSLTLAGALSDVSWRNAASPAARPLIIAVWVPFAMRQSHST